MIIHIMEWNCCICGSDWESCGCVWCIVCGTAQDQAWILREFKWTYCDYGSQYKEKTRATVCLGCNQLLDDVHGTCNFPRLVGASWVEATEVFDKWFNMYCIGCSSGYTRYAMGNDFSCNCTKCGISNTSLCRECITVVRKCYEMGITPPCVCDLIFTSRRSYHENHLYKIYHKARYASVMTQITCMPPNGVEFIAAKQHYEYMRNKYCTRIKL